MRFGPNPQRSVHVRSARRAPPRGCSAHLGAEAGAAWGGRRASHMGELDGRALYGVRPRLPPRRELDADRAGVCVGAEQTAMANTSSTRAGGSRATKQMCCSCFSGRPTGRCSPT